MIKKIINEHGSAVGLLAVIVAIVGVALFVIGTNDQGVLGSALSSIITNMPSSMTP